MRDGIYVCVRTDAGEVTILNANETPGTYNANGVSEGGIWTLDIWLAT